MISHTNGEILLLVLTYAFVFFSTQLLNLRLVHSRARLAGAGLSTAWLLLLSGRYLELYSSPREDCTLEVRKTRLGQTASGRDYMGKTHIILIRLLS